MALKSIFFIVYVIFVPGIYSEVEFNAIANKIAVNLFTVMPQTNLVVSPLMVCLPLIKLAAFTSNETKKELMRALGYKDETWMHGTYNRIREVITKLQRLDLLFINKVYIDSGYSIIQSFFKNSVYATGTQVEAVSFKYPEAVVSFINKLMATSTLRRISEVIDTRDINQNTSMVIVSGVYFKATWELPFNYERTKLTPFSYRNGTKTHVQMMMKVDYYLYVDTGEYQAIRLGLHWRDTDVILILPYNREALPSLLHKVQAKSDYLAPFLNRMKEEFIVLKLPKFKIKTYVDWTGFLQEIGLYSIFDCNSSNMNGMLKPGVNRTRNPCLNKIKQKVFLDVDEMGVAKRIFSKTGGPGDLQEGWADDIEITNHAKEMTFDVPFLFMVNIRSSDQFKHELLTGVYYGPE